MRPKTILLSLFGVMLFSAAPLASQAASDYPNREIRLVNPTGNGGAQDRMSRITQRYLPESLGQQVLVETRPGAGGRLGVDYVLRQPADGYTVLSFHSAGLSEVIKRSEGSINLDDFVFINVQWPEYSLFYTREDTGWKTFADFVEAAKKEPDKYVVATPVATSPDTVLLNQLFKVMNLPVKLLSTNSGGETRMAVQGGHAQAAINGAPGLVTETGIVGLAYAGAERTPDWPDVATFNEQLTAYNLQMAPLGGDRLYAVRREFKENDPEGFAKLVEAFRSMTQENKAFKDACVQQNVGTQWLGPEESTKIALATHEAVMKDIRVVEMPGTK